MANFAKIDITFNEVAQLNNIFSFDATNPSISISETAKTVRFTPNQFEKGSTAEQSAEGYRAALVTDYGFQFDISRIGVIVTIEADSYDIEFENFNFPAYVDVNYTPPVQPPSEFEIGTITAGESIGPNKCTEAMYSFTVLNSVPADFPIQITSPVSKIAATVNDLYFDYSRFPVPQQTLTIVSAQGGSPISKLLPRVSTFDFGSVSVQETFQGATITLNASIVNNGDIGLSLTYSIDDVNYFASNVFYGILPGTRTAYVKDNFGCTKTLPFTVVGITVDKPAPIFNISNGNSIKYYKSETYDYKTTFPFLDNADINNQDIFNTEKRCYKQPFQTNDSVPTQIQTNYDNTTVEIYNLYTDELITTISPTLVQENILQKDKRDCKIISGGDGKTNIYFPGGDIYDPDTTNVIGDYTNPSLKLPEYLDSGTLQSGVLATLSGNIYLNGSFDVEGKVYNSVILGQALQINAIYTGGINGEDAIVQNIYNALDYNDWEFSINWGGIGEGDYYIKVTSTDPDPRYNDVEWLSEPVSVKGRQNGTVYIEWFNSSNYAQMNYATGIVNFMRIPARFAKYQQGGEKETFESAEGNIQTLRTVLTRDITIETSIFPQYIQEKLNIINGHDNVTINGQKGAFVDKAEEEDLFDEQNRFYKQNAVFRLNKTDILTDTSGVVSDVEEVLGTGAGEFVLGIGG